MSTLNHGTGVPCTLQAVGYEMVPAIAAPIRKREQFATEQAATVQRATDAVEELERLVNAAGLSGKKRDEILAQARVAKSALVNGAEFVGKQFGEHMERVVESAKTEVEAYMQSTVTRAGLKALAKGSRPLLELEPETDE